MPLIPPDGPSSCRSTEHGEFAPGRCDGHTERRSETAASSGTSDTCGKTEEQEEAASLPIGSSVHSLHQHQVTNEFSQRHSPSDSVSLLVSPARSGDSSRFTFAVSPRRRLCTWGRQGLTEWSQVTSPGSLIADSCFGGAMHRRLATVQADDCWEKAERCAREGEAALVLGHSYNRSVYCR